MSPQAVLPGLNLPPWSLSPQRAIMGIDPSTRRMSAAVLVPVAERGDVAFVVDTLSLPQPGTESLRMAWSQRAMVPWMGGLIERWEPELVVIEQPFAAARHVPPVSYYVIGVLLAVLGTFGVRVEMIQPSSWKKMALGAGRGGVKKPGKCEKGGAHAWPGDVTECLKCGAPEYAVLTWARAAGYDGALWDEADAIGIATAAGVLLEREKRG